MRPDLICAENELSIAINSINTYSDFLSRTIDSYISILSKIQDEGINDDLICEQLSNVADEIKPYIKDIYEESEEISKNIRDFISEISEVDDFKFPFDITAPIASLLANFM
jgi:methyl-accepting chemotaxis protein